MIPASLPGGHRTQALAGLKNKPALKAGLSPADIRNGLVLSTGCSRKVLSPKKSFKGAKGREAPNRQGAENRILHLPCVSGSEYRHGVQRVVLRHRGAIANSGLLPPQHIADPPNL